MLTARQMEERMTVQQTEGSNAAGAKRPKAKSRSPKLSPEQRAAAAEERQRKTAEAKQRKLEETERKKRDTEEKKRLAEAKKLEAAAAAAAEKQRSAEAKKLEAAKAAAEKQRRMAAAASQETLMKALEGARSNSNQLLALSDIAKCVQPTLRADFLASWKVGLESGSLPAGVGSLSVKSGSKSVRKLFLLSDVRPSVAGAQPAAGQKPALVPGLQDRILAEFDRLNEAAGGRFYVSLFDLRNALPDMSKGDFETALNELRKAWVLTLNPAEGRHEAVPAHVLDAGVMDQSRLLVYVARRES
jgi:hypothetical protein